METFLEIIIAFLFILIIGYLLFLLYIMQSDLNESTRCSFKKEFRVHCLDENESLIDYKWMRGGMNGANN
jgi:hypothetical protein